MIGAERPDLLVRLAATATAISALSDVVAAEEPLNELLLRVAQAARAIPNADSVSITVLIGEDRKTPVCTDEQVNALDRVQEVSGQGPCIEAAKKRIPVCVRTSSLADADRWPEFTEQAKTLGVRASLSAPLLVGDGDAELVGSLNVYSHTASAFDLFDEGLFEMYALSAGHAITTTRRRHTLRDKVSSLERALHSRPEIDQAKGALMAVHGCTADEAFQQLVRGSQDHNVKLHDVVRRLLASLRRGAE